MPEEFRSPDLVFDTSGHSPALKHQKIVNDGQGGINSDVRTLNDMWQCSDGIGIHESKEHLEKSRVQGSWGWSA